LVSPISLRVEADTASKVLRLEYEKGMNMRVKFKKWDFVILIGSIIVSFVPLALRFSANKKYCRTRSNNFCFGKFSKVFEA